MNASEDLEDPGSKKFGFIVSTTLEYAYLLYLLNNNNTTREYTTTRRVVV